MREKPENPLSTHARLFVDRATLERLREAVKKAEAENREEFKFEGHDFFVPYAKYLIQFLDGRVAAGLL